MPTNSSICFALSLLGVFLGSLIAFRLSNALGGKWVTKVVDQQQLSHFQSVFKKRGIAAALISYSIPLFPSDTLSLLLGMMPITKREFLFVALIGHIPRVLIVNSFGSSLHNGFTFQTVVVWALAGMFLGIALWRKKIKRWIFPHHQERTVQTS